METKTEQDRIREVMEARKTMVKFTKMAWCVGAVIVAGGSLLFGGLVPFLIAGAAYVGLAYFLQYSFKQSDAQDLKRIAELDANPAKGQGLAAQGLLGSGAGLAQEVQNNLAALASSAAKMENERDETLAAIETLRSQVTAISKSLVEIRGLMGKIDESKASEVELAQLANLQDQEKAQLAKLENINTQARDLKVVLDNSLAAGAAEAGDNGQVEAALRSIKVGAAVNAQMKDLH